MKQCTHCGKCCLSGIPCTFGRILFNITDNNRAPCPACEKQGKLFYCGIIKHPVKWLSPLLGTTDWRCEALAHIVSVHNGTGLGCGINPEIKQLLESMNFKRLTNEVKCANK